MKTITEFAYITIKNASKTRQDLLAGGKTAEELPAALGEALTLEGDKLNFMVAALDAVGEKFNELKRVIVSTIGEGEKAPAGAKQVGDHYYTVEYFKPVQARSAAPQDSRDGGRGGRGDKGGRGGRGGARDGKGGGREGGRDSRGPSAGAPGDGRPARAPRAAQPPRPTGPVSLPKPLSAPKNAPVSAPKPVEAVAAAAAPTETQDSSQTS